MILPVSKGSARQVVNLQGWLLRNNVLLSVTMNSPSLRASPMMDGVFIITQNLFPSSRDQIAVSVGVANQFFPSKAYYGDHVLKPGVEASPGNFILVIVGLLHPVCPHDPETYHTSYLRHYLRCITLMTGARGSVFG
jgi:hypothetical protein